VEGAGGQCSRGDLGEAELSAAVGEGLGFRVWVHAAQGEEAACSAAAGAGADGHLTGGLPPASVRAVSNGGQGAMVEDGAAGGQPVASEGGPDQSQSVGFLGADFVELPDSPPS
jgi:hypothetical protein